MHNHNFQPFPCSKPWCKSLGCFENHGDLDESVPGGQCLVYGQKGTDWWRTMSNHPWRFDQQMGQKCMVVNCLPYSRHNIWHKFKFHLPSNFLPFWSNFDFTWDSPFRSDLTQALKRNVNQKQVVEAVSVRNPWHGPAPASLVGNFPPLAAGWGSDQCTHLFHGASNA